MLALAPASAAAKPATSPHTLVIGVDHLDAANQQPFGFDCGPTPPFYIGVPPTPGAPPPSVCVEPGERQPEAIGDPGNAPPGTLLSSPSQLVDAGLRVGTAYGVTPSSQRWSLRTGPTTATGVYQFQCTVHDWMRGTLTVSHPG